MAWDFLLVQKRYFEALQDQPSPVKTLIFTRTHLCLSLDYLLARISSTSLRMKHKSPAKLLRSIKRITKYIERKKNQSPPPSAVQNTCPSSPLDMPLPKITLADFQSLLESVNRKTEDLRRRERSEMEEERRLERAEDLKWPQLCLRKK